MKSKKIVLTTIDYDKMNMKNYVNSNNKLTKEGSQQIYEAYGATCK